MDSSQWHGYLRYFVQGGPKSEPLPFLNKLSKNDIACQKSFVCDK